MRAVELFAGVGGFRLGLERAGHEVVYANEWDKYACDTYDKNFGGSIDRRSITDVPATDVPDHDIICGGFPCQAFSIAGKRRGFDETRGTLFFEIMRLAQAHRTPYLFLENVKGLLNHDKGRTFETILRTMDELGYDCQWQVLNSKNFGVPQNRERIFIIGHLRGEPRPEVFPLGESDGRDTSSRKDDRRAIANTVTQRFHKGVGNTESRIIDVVIDPSGRSFKKITEVGDAIRQLNNPTHSNDRVYGIDGIAPILNTMQGGNRQPFVAMTETRTEEAKAIRRETKDRDFSPRRGKVLVPRTDDTANTVTAGLGKESFVTDLTRIRRLTPVECERLQGFPDNWTAGVSDTQRYKQMGNAVTVNVIEAIAKQLAKPFNDSPESKETE